MVKFSTLESEDTCHASKYEDICRMPYPKFPLALSPGAFAVFLQILLWAETTYSNLGQTHLSKSGCGSQHSAKTQDEIFSLDTMGIIWWLEKGEGLWVCTTLRTLGTTHGQGTEPGKPEE